MWIKLKKRIDDGSVKYLLPTGEELAFNNGDRLKCKLSNTLEVELEIVHRYVPYEKSDTSGIFLIDRKTPSVKDDNGKLYELDEVEVDSEEIRNFLA